MDEKVPSLSLAVVVTCLLITIPLGLYVAGYFALGKSDVVNVGPDLSDILGPEFRPGRRERQVWRGFEQQWLVDVYRPMAAIEATVTGVDVHVGVLATDFDFNIDDSE